MFTSTLRLATGLVLLSASIGASAGPATTKPLEITGVFQERTGPKPNCPSQFGGTLAGVGDSVQMGRLVFVATDCITPVPPLFNFTGRFIVTTLSGEQIYANYSGQFVPTGEGTKHVFSGATFQIIGGTGKYAKATGGGALTGAEDIVTGNGNLKLSGQIHSKDKDKDD
jgi:hypothetical protein